MTGAGAAEQTVASAINRAAGGRPIPGNDVELLIDGPCAYDAMLDVIANATRWIHFENYIIRADAAGRRFADLLARRAREGVRVRVLYDGLGSWSTPRKYWRVLRDAGVEVRAFRPLSPIDLVSNFSRNHRKLVVGDGSRAVIGGLCIGCEWTGEDSADGSPWRDTAVEIRGPAAAVLDQAFGRTWGIAGGVVADDHVAGRVTPQGSAEVRVISGEPGRERTYRVIELLAAGSSSRLWITDAYLVAPPRLFQALRDAAKDGVDVRLLVPGSSDLPLVRNLSRIGYRELLRSGVRIYEWDGPMLHAKTIVADGRWSRVGSSNLNPSSLLGNWELDVLVEDSSLAEAMERQFRLDVARSREVIRRPARGPQRLSAALPTVLRREAPEVAARLHQPTSRERRRRAALAMRALMANARRSIFLPLSAILISLGALFFALPRFTAYVFGALCGWLALSAWREAFRRRDKAPIGR
ncbi:MAG TPA: phospholipase D-like domain-containing protein [Gemmatimonadales bacterium]|jgi:cardiolipin synthase|nr:phospholipase D-like domain-containing protein [Gemmatimonadales bacterium]